MAQETFIWLPDRGATQTRKPTVSVIKFGDGYEQRIGKGINRSLAKWSMKFSGTGDRAAEILAFLEARGGAESFIWTDPMGVTGTYVCREWKSSQVKRSIYEVSCDFEQVPD